MKTSSHPVLQRWLSGWRIRTVIASISASLAISVTCSAEPTFVSFQEDDVRTNSDPYTVSSGGTVVTNVYNMGATYLRSNQATTVQDTNTILLGFNTSSGGQTYRALFAFDVSYITNIVGMDTSRVDSVALVLTHDAAGSGATPKDVSVHLTNPFEETNATWNLPYFGAGPAGGVAGVELRRASVTMTATSPSQVIWGSPNLLWPTTSTNTTLDGLVDAVRQALASGSNTVYFLVKSTVENAGFTRIKGDNNATVDDRPELRVGIDSAGLVGNSVGVVATVPQVQQSDTNNPGKFSIYRTGNTNSTVTVNFSYTGTAIETIHYNWGPFINPPSVTLVPGQTNAEVTITPIAVDPASGPNRTVILNLAAVPGYIVSASAATVTIVPDTLVTYGFNENTNDINLTLSAVATGTVATAISGQVTANNAAAGSGLGVFGDTTSGVASHYYIQVGGEFVSAPSSLTLRGNTLTNNLSDAIAGNDYLSFTIAPKPGAALNFTGMGFQAKMGNNGITVDMVLRSSLDSFTSDLGILSTIGNGAFSSVTTSLSDPGLTQAIAPIEFRLYFYSSGLTNATQTIRVDDVVFNGTPTNLPSGVQQLTVVATGNAAEPSVAGSFTLTRGGSVASPLTVNYTLSGTAINGVDYQTLSGTTNFAAAQTSLVLPVVPIDNNVISPGRTVVMTLATDAAYTLLSSAASVSIADDDAVTVSLTNSIPVANEAGPVAGEFTLSRTGNTNGALTVYYNIAGTATNGVQYQTLSGTASFAPNVGTVAIPVIPLADGIPSPPLTVILTLTNDPNGLTYYLAAPTNGTVTIIDDNDPPQLNVIAFDTNAYERVSLLTGRLRIDRYGSTNSAFTANFSFGGTAVLGVDYTASATNSVDFAAGDLSQIIVISPVDNALLDGNRTVTLTVQSGAGYTVGPTASDTTTIVDDELPPATVLWSDNFDSLTSSNNYSLIWWAENAVADYYLDFAADYSTANIPPAPGSTNTIGLLLTVNKNDAVGAGAVVNLYPNGQSFSGDFALRFNLLCNYGNLNGEKVLFGINHTGTATNRVDSSVGPAGPGDGVFGAITINFQSIPTVELLAVTNGTTISSMGLLQPGDLWSLFQSPPFGQSGILGNTNDSLTKTWVDVELGQVGDLVTLKLNNTAVLQFTNTGVFTNGNIMLGYFDVAPSIGSLDGYAVIDNVRVVQLVASVTQPVITNIGVAGGTVTINFTGGASDTAGQFALQSSATVNGAYVDDNTANLTGGGGSFQATTAASGATRFYRIRR